MVLVTVRLARAAATLEHAIERLGLDRDEVDLDYGLVAIDPERGLYGLRVTERVWQEGDFSDPRIEPYGPPKRD
ncbi:hypothetical protein ACIBH1_23085 [Nonomuraea sp. NPDC050663]|uniref:hypothetical protein n=1 Tax=Nonomuraea sp. NPDC050663 TaxID=3364370 RepID=UPI00379B49F5